MLNVNLYQIRDYIESIAQKDRINSFYPQTVSRKLNIPLDLVVLELYKIVDEGCIDLKYEIRCNSDNHIMITVDNYLEVLDKGLFCEICGENIEISYNNIYPIYYINPEYKELIKKK